MRIGIDLLYIKLGKVGGLESFAQNLLQGFGERPMPDTKYVLFVASDNRTAFKDVAARYGFEIETTAVKSTARASRLLYDWFLIDSAARRAKIDVMFSPVFSKPLFRTAIPWVTVIHDLQPLRYPQFFSWPLRMILLFGWRHALKTSVVVVDSEYVKSTIAESLGGGKDVRVIYVPVAKAAATGNFAALRERWSISGEFLYTVSSMAPHKNLETLLKMLAELRSRGEDPPLLVVSGVGDQRGLNARAEELGVRDLVRSTGFISDADRDALYAHCKVFLFPSMYEGFGMPQVEALRLGKRTIVSDIPVNREVSMGCCEYVRDFTDPKAWADVVGKARQAPAPVSLERYDIKRIAADYHALFAELAGIRRHTQR